MIRLSSSQLSHNVYCFLCFMCRPMFFLFIRFYCTVCTSCTIFIVLRTTSDIHSITIMKNSKSQSSVPITATQLAQVLCSVNKSLQQSFGCLQFSYLLIQFLCLRLQFIQFQSFLLSKTGNEIFTFPLFP